MARHLDKYADFADHPRFGRRPNITGINPSPLHADVNLHWNATEPGEIVAKFEAATGKKWSFGGVNSYAKDLRRIPNTAIVADLARQTPATVPVTHYFDVERKCRDCDRWFIFFAEEQKYWYEELGFGLDSDCVRCAECRKTQQGIARQRHFYETLFHVPNRTVEQTLQMAEGCLSLIEAGVFSPNQTQRVRMLLNLVKDDDRGNPAALVNRLRAVEEGSTPT